MFQDRYHVLAQNSTSGERSHRSCRERSLGRCPSLMRDRAHHPTHERTSNRVGGALSRARRRAWCCKICVPGGVQSRLGSWSTNAARILGLYPRKGVIAVGSDADIVLIDPSIKKTLTRDDFHVSDYSPWEGWPVEGWPTTTILRGKVIVENGQLFGKLGDGHLVPRKIDPVVLRRPAS